MSHEPERTVSVPAALFDKATWRKVEFGDPESLQYRMLFLDSQGNEVSPWHDVALQANDSGLVNFVCLTPQGHRAEYEVAIEEPYTAIRLKQESNSSAQVLDMGSWWKVGFLPQTWVDCDGSWGDQSKLGGFVSGRSDQGGGPLGVVALGSRTAVTGDVYPVKLLGAFALVGNEGQLSWKLVGVAADEERFTCLTSMQQLQTSFPNLITEVRDWLGTCHSDSAVGEGENHLANSGRPMGDDWAQRVVAEGHASWRLWMAERDPRPNWSLPPGTGPRSPAEYQALWAQFVGPRGSVSVAPIAPGQAGPPSEVHLERAWADSSDMDKWEREGKKGDGGGRLLGSGTGLEKAGQRKDKGKAMRGASKKVSTFFRSLTKGFRGSPPSSSPQFKINPKEEGRVASSLDKPFPLRPGCYSSSRTEEWFDGWDSQSVSEVDPGSQLDESLQALRHGPDSETGAAGALERSPAALPEPVPRRLGGFHSRSASFSSPTSKSDSFPSRQEVLSFRRSFHRRLSWSSINLPAGGPQPLQNVHPPASQPQSGSLDSLGSLELTDDEQGEKAAMAEEASSCPKPSPSLSPSAQSPPSPASSTSSSEHLCSSSQPGKDDPIQAWRPASLVTQLSFTESSANIPEPQQPDPGSNSGPPPPVLVSLAPTTSPLKLPGDSPAATAPAGAPSEPRVQVEAVELLPLKPSSLAAGQSEETTLVGKAEERPCSSDAAEGVPGGKAAESWVQGNHVPRYRSGPQPAIESDLWEERPNERQECQQAKNPMEVPGISPPRTFFNGFDNGMHGAEVSQSSSAAEGWNQTSKRRPSRLLERRGNFQNKPALPLPALQVSGRPMIPTGPQKSPTGLQKSPTGLPKSPTGLPKSPSRSCSPGPQRSSPHLSPSWSPSSAWGEGNQTNTDGNQSESSSQGQTTVVFARSKSFHLPEPAPRSPENWRPSVTFRRTNSESFSSSWSSDSSGLSPTSTLDLRGRESRRPRPSVRTVSRVVTTKGFKERRKEQEQLMREEMFALQGLSLQRTTSAPPPECNDPACTPAA